MLTNMCKLINLIQFDGVVEIYTSCVEEEPKINQALPSHVMHA